MEPPSVRRWALESLGLALLYGLTAYIVASVQAGLGAANLLWLPAGIALTAVLWRGTSMLPAIFLASAVFDYLTLYAPMASPLQAGAATLVTAAGSTAQAWISAWLLRRWLNSLQITTMSDALIFILCAAVGGTIAASIGTLTLFSQARIGSDALSLTWLTWWVGDLSGMLVVTPLALVAGYWRRGKREWSLLSLPIIGLGCSFTLVSAFVVKHVDHDARVSEFLNSGVAMGQTLQRTLDLSFRDLMATHALFYNIDVNRAEFRNFTAAVLERNPQIRSLAWVPRVGKAERLGFEIEAQRRIRPDFRIYDWGPNGEHITAPEHKEYFPVLLSEPESSSPNVFGFNVLSEPTRSEAVKLSRASGEPKASRRVDLIRGGTAVVVYWPVYRNEYAGTSRIKDDDNLRGFVTMALEIGKLAEQTLKPFETREGEAWLVDVSNPDAPQLLYHHIDGLPSLSVSGPPPDLEQLRQGLYQETAHSFAGREWLLISRPVDIGINLRANGQFIGILVGGSGLTFMLALYMIGRQRSEHELRARDERLMSQNAVLTHLARYGLTPEIDVDRQLRELVATSAVTLKVERVSIWVLEDEDRSLRCRVLFQRETGEFSEGLCLNAEQAPNYFAALYEGRGFAANEAQTDPRTREFTETYLKPLGITSMMDVPLRIGGRPSGVVCHEHIGPPRVWAADEQNFAASIGDLASLVIEGDKRRQAERALQDSYQALERKVQERTEQLRAANERLRQLDQLKSMFIASMSHELRTPLNSIIGFTGVVLQGISGPLSDKQKDHLNRVYGSARHLLDLITDVIDISKIEAGYADVYIEEFSVNQLLEEAVATVQPQRLEKQLELDFEADAALNIRSDRKRLLQCVLNLLSNAIKYSERGTVRVRLKAENERVVIEVADEGIGIAPEALAKLFQPFERIDTHLRVKTPGTGLGLYLTRKIMSDLLQGDVSASSSVGKGSIFTLWVPYAPAPVPTEQSPA
ncbi:MAG TPA: CHASE domain-containing protein [Rhodocyclaceae bacterium]|nr:CHASE domain-containing protein [Rhodocyclaceae bacterium]